MLSYNQAFTQTLEDIKVLAEMREKADEDCRTYFKLVLRRDICAKLVSTMDQISALSNEEDIARSKKQWLTAMALFDKITNLYDERKDLEARLEILNHGFYN